MHFLLTVNSWQLFIFTEHTVSTNNYWMSCGLYEHTWLVDLLYELEKTSQEMITMPSRIQIWSFLRKSQAAKVRKSLGRNLRKFQQCRPRFQRCVDTYPRIDILQISAILTDTDSNFLLWMDTDVDTMLRIFYGYALCLNFILFLNFISCLVSTLDTGTSCIVIEFSNINYRRITKTNQPWVMTDNNKKA